jgi:hypothetical protein
MTDYKIYRWDVILAPNGLNKMPIIYVMPDLEFLEFIKNNSYQVMIEINGSNTIYDGKQIFGTVNTSSFMPNFSEQTNLYVVTMECVWYGYPEPESLGNVKFFGLKS